MRYLILTLAIGSLLLACDRRGDTDMQSTRADATATAPADSAAPAAQDAVGDGEVLGLLSALNTHQVAAADQALAHDLSGPVSDFASMMKREHSENDARTRALGALAETEAVRAQNVKGSSDLEMLATHTEDYEKAYVDAMVDGHTEALKLIDGKLLPAASGDAVKTHLSTTRNAVAQHLDDARRLQRNLASK